MKAETDLHRVLAPGRAVAIGALIAGIASAASLAVPARSSASVGCTFAGGTMTVTVTSSEAVTLIRNGTDIEARVANIAQACSGGTPTTTTTGSIVLDDNSAAPQDVGATIDLSGGAFAPGIPTEGATSEIEFSIEDIEFLTIRGTPGADSIRVGSIGANLNVAAEACLFCPNDVDVTLTGTGRILLVGDDSGDVLSGGGAAGTGGPTSIPMFLHGENGNDSLVGGDADDSIGKPLEPDDDELTGGGGDDLIYANDGDDEVNGGSGADTATYVNSAGAVTIDMNTTTAQNTGGAGLDTLGGIENLDGSPYNDQIVGTGGDNVLDGANGGDFIDARGGSDAVRGDGPSGSAYTGADTIRIRDGAGDSATCGPLADTVIADDPDLDTITADCEVSLLRERLLRISGRKRQSIRRRVKIIVSCPQEDCSSVVGGGAARKRSTSLATGESATLKLRLKRRARRRAARALRNHRKAKVQITVTALDGAGGSDVDKLTIRLKR